MRLTWQYGQRVHGDLSIKWFHNLNESGSYYRVWNRKTGIVILSIWIFDDGFSI